MRWLTIFLFSCGDSTQISNITIESPCDSFKEVLCSKILSCDSNATLEKCYDFYNFLFELCPLKDQEQVEYCTEDIPATGCGVFPDSCKELLK